MSKSYKQRNREDLAQLDTMIAQVNTLICGMLELSNASHGATSTIAYYTLSQAREQLVELRTMAMIGAGMNAELQAELMKE
jgi:ornithine cyclodeaminase/alanine dehydrogenase-like protein (mu-crystallin family)